MVRTRGGQRFGPRGQTRTPTRDGSSISRAFAGHSQAQGAEAPPSLSPTTAMIQSLASTDILEESQGAEPTSRRYHTRVGPRPPSPVHPRQPQRAPPSKRTRTSGPRESSRSRPEPLQSPATQDPTQSSPQLSPALRIRHRPFSYDAIPGT